MNKKPKVSVLTPNLNNRPFLEERIKTVLNQTFTDFEYIIVDSYSDDGAWELIQEYAEKDSRMKISQAPRGLYTCWNTCIQQAKGEYIYIATSDDTMMPDCLEEMVNALDAHHECGICHCCLKVIDEKGEEIPEWWYNMMLAPRFYGNLMKISHIRFAPYDGILHCFLCTVYKSVAQLLIRYSVFDEVGLFRIDWGSDGDNEWEMRASLIYNTIHIPEILATWRIHPDQVTKNDNSKKSLYYKKFLEMIKEALNSESSRLKQQHPKIYSKINMYNLVYPYTQEYIRLSLGERPNKIDKFLFLLRFLVKAPRCVSEYLFRRIFRKLLSRDDFTYVRRELKRLGLENYIKIL